MTIEGITGLSSGQMMAGEAPGLVGVHGRLRLRVGDKLVGTLIVEGTHVGLIPDVEGPSDACVVCSSEDDLRHLLLGELNPFIASMRGWARLTGNRQFGTQVALGLRVGSPFGDLFKKGT